MRCRCCAHIPDAHFEYDFAPHGERSIARAYNKVVPLARRLIYVEDQYLWSKPVAELFARALRDNPDLHLRWLSYRGMPMSMVGWHCRPT